MNPAKIDKMDEEISKWRKKDLIAIKRSMSKPGKLSMTWIVYKLRVRDMDIEKIVSAFLEHSFQV